MKERFEAVDNEFIKFERIPVEQRLHPNYHVCGLLKVAQLMKNPEKFSMCAEHDILYLAGERELQELTDEDIVYLLRCGIHWNSDGDCLAIFT